MKKIVYNNYIRIDKRIAKRLFELGCGVVLVPSKCRPSWLVSYEINNECDYFTFESQVNNFMFYNCITELGKRVHYYITTENADYYKIKY